MNINQVHSYDELAQSISQNEKTFLLLYKSGAENSDCALERLKNMPLNRQGVLIADVNTVRDIHLRFQISTAPSLLVFEGNKLSNIFKGCQSETAYDSIISGRSIGATASMGGSPAKQVTVYSTPSCSWCTTLKSYLDQKQIKYREINVASDTSAAEAMVKKSGQQGVPQTEINGQMIVGFDKNRINQLLEIK